MKCDQGVVVEQAREGSLAETEMINGHGTRKGNRNGDNNQNDNNNHNNNYYYYSNESSKYNP